MRWPRSGLATTAPAVGTEGTEAPHQIGDSSSGSTSVVEARWRLGLGAENAAFLAARRRAAGEEKRR
jgi:hypothetical protein